MSQIFPWSNTMDQRLSCGCPERDKFVQNFVYAADQHHLLYVYHLLFVRQLFRPVKVAAHTCCYIHLYSVFSTPSPLHVWQVFCIQQAPFRTKDVRYSCNLLPLYGPGQYLHLTKVVCFNFDLIAAASRAYSNGCMAFLQAGVISRCTICLRDTLPRSAV